MTCPHLVDSGVYVLGALAPAQRMAFEAHMADCAECRAEVNELAVLPGLLGRLDEAAVARVSDRMDEPARSHSAQDPTGLVPKVLKRVHRQRRVRRLAAFAGAIAVACLALIAGLTVPHPAGSRPPVTTPAAAHEMRQVNAASPVSAQVALWAVDGGTQFSLTCTYSGTGYPGSYTASAFSLYVYPRDGGAPQQVGTWTARPGQTLTVPGQTEWSLSNVSRVELRAADGTPLLEYSTA